MTTVALLSTSDTDLLSARSAGVGYGVGNPARLTDEQIAERVARADVVVEKNRAAPGGLAGAPDFSWPHPLATARSAMNGRASEEGPRSGVFATPFAQAA